MIKKEVKAIRYLVLLWLILNLSLLPLAAAYSPNDNEVSIIRKPSVSYVKAGFGRITPLSDGYPDNTNPLKKPAPAVMVVWSLFSALLVSLMYFRFNRRAEFNTAFIIILAVLVGGVIIIFGYRIIRSNIGGHCITGLNIFQEDIKAAIDENMLRVGSVEEYKFRGLCGFDKIYFVDKYEDVNVSRLNDIPEIVDSVNSSSKDNLFLAAASALERALYIGSINIPSPHYLCFEVENGILNMLLEGKGDSTRLKHKENMFNCGPTIVEPTMGEVENISKEAADLGLNETEIVDRFSETEDDVDISRQIDCENQDALVEIEISPGEGSELENFTYIEWIPKNCIDDITGILETSGDYIIKGDPLIVWEFGDIDEEEEIIYKLRGKCNETIDCEAVMEGLGFAERVEKISNLRGAKKYNEYHTGKGDDFKDEIKKNGDSKAADVSIHQLLHIKTRKKLRNDDKIIIYANCSTSGTIFLKEEGPGTEVASESCSGTTQRLELTISGATKSNEEWDLTSTGTGIVYYDYITSERVGGRKGRKDDDD